MIELTARGTTRIATLGLPPGAPGRPPTMAELSQKLAVCGADLPNLDWAGARELLAQALR